MFRANFQNKAAEDAEMGEMNGQDKSKLKRGVNNLLYVELRHPSGAQLDVYLHGAHAVSWRDSGGRSLLFLSKKSFFDSDRPIRGGIPVIFPQFGDGPLPKHGFARIHEWKLLGAGLSDNDGAEARFELKDDRETIKLWPYKFRLELVFRLKAAGLEISFSVQNAGQTEFEFKNGLHTYFSTADITKTSVSGLAGADFVDFLGDAAVGRETRKKIRFGRETDRVYPFAPEMVVLEDGTNRQKITIKKNGMHDIVLWNPWTEKSKRMDDFGDEEYHSMVCVETGNLHQPIRLAPGEKHLSGTRLELVNQ